MKTMTLRVAGLAAGIILCAQLAQAGETYFSFSVVSPGYYANYVNGPVYPQPVVYAPQPVIYQPAPIVYYPQTFYYQPQPVYYYQPQPVYYRPNYYNHQPVYHHQNMEHRQPERREVSQPVQRHQEPARHDDRDDHDRKTRTTSPYLR